MDFGFDVTTAQNIKGDRKLYDVTQALVEPVLFDPWMLPAGSLLLG